METWIGYDKLDVDIEWIQQFCGGDGECSLFFVDSSGQKGKLHFPCIYDFRYAIENAFISRYADVSREKGTGFNIVEDSEYIKYFEYQVSGTRPIDDIKHYAIFDAMDTGIEVLATREPVLTWLDEGDGVSGE